MRKAIMLSAMTIAAFLPTPGNAAQDASFHFRLPVATIAGELDENGVLVVYSFTVYGSYAGMNHQVNRVYCPLSGCPSMAGGNCVEAEGDILDNGYFQADVVSVLPRSECF